MQGDKMGYTVTAQSSRFDDLEKKLNDEISSFNSLAKKHGHRMRLRYLPDQPMYCGRLVLGRKEQFEYDTYECILAHGLDAAYNVAISFRMYHCAEFG